MSKYYRVRSQRQWDWLMKWFEESDKYIRWNYVSEKPTEHQFWKIFCEDTYVVSKGKNILYGSVDNQEVIGKHFIEVSCLMEDEKMKNYVTIKGEGLGRLYDEHGNFAFSKIPTTDISKACLSELRIPKSLLYPKIQFTKAEKKEFDSIDNDETLSNALDIIEREDYPNLYGRIYYHTVPEYQKFELEFARAWADPSLIEVIPDRKRKVKVPRSDESYYFKDKIDGKAYLTTVSVDPKNANGALFTDEELKQFGLDDNLFEKVEVQE